MLLKALGVCSKPAQPPGSSTVVETVTNKRTQRIQKVMNAMEKKRQGRGRAVLMGRQGLILQRPLHRGAL